MEKMETIQMDYAQAKQDETPTDGYVRAAVDALADICGDVQLSKAQPDAKTVSEWRSEYRNYNSIFRRWCEINVRSSACDGEIEDIFGAATGLLDVANMEISWPLWHAHRWSSYVAREHGCLHASPDIVGELKCQLNLISEYKLDQMGNPALFPPPAEILRKLSYAAGDLNTFEAVDNAEKMFRRLENQWVSDGSTRQVLDTLMVTAATAEARCSYHPARVFKIFRAEVFRWAQATCLDELLEIVMADGSLDAAVDKLAMEMMVWQEKEMVSAIARASKTSEAGKTAFSRERLAQLSSGSRGRA